MKRSAFVEIFRTGVCIRIELILKDGIYEHKLRRKLFIYRLVRDMADSYGRQSEVEYIWLDGYEPTQNMRSKTMVRSISRGPRRVSDVDV